jgi:hypothetical protein
MSPPSIQPPSPARPFKLGVVVATNGAIDALLRSGETPTIFIHRHQRGDFGDLTTEDRRANEEAVAHEGDPSKQFRILSVYSTRHNEKLWIITEADRSLTTILTPDEY